MPIHTPTLNIDLMFGRAHSGLEMYTYLHCDIIQVLEILIGFTAKEFKEVCVRLRCIQCLYTYAYVYVNTYTDIV